MDERVVAQIPRLAQRIFALEQFRTADGEHHVLEQPVCVQARIVALAETDADIDILAGEIDQSLRHLDPDIGLRMLQQETIEPRHQPFGRE
jgi:hypothetical protein